MLSTISKRSVAMLARRMQNSAPMIAGTRAFAAKSWVPDNSEKLQAVTTQALIHEVAEQQKSIASKVVPWFLTNMPAAYFRHVPEAVRTQHVHAVTAIRELSQSDLSLKIKTNVGTTSQVTFINSQAKSGLLFAQIKSLDVPENTELSNVQVFSSADNTLALNIFSFTSNKVQRVAATRASATEELAYLADLKAGKYVNDPNHAKFNEKLHSDAAINDYLNRVTPSYAETIDPRRFFIQREMYEAVRNTDGTTVHVEKYIPEGKDAANSVTGNPLYWVSIAAANVLPEVLLRLTSAIVSARHLDIARAHLDSVNDPENSTPEIPGTVTFLRLLVSANKDQGDLFSGADFTRTLSRDLKRAKWLDPATTDLGLNQYPSLGLEKAEVITAFGAMAHGPLSKSHPQAFPSIASVVQSLTANESTLKHSERIATLFLERFNPKTNGMNEAEFSKRVDSIRKDLGQAQADSSAVALNRFLDGVVATLRTNVYNENRYALSVRVHPSIMATGDIGQPGSVRPLPFGVFFIHGRHFNAFHCRFRDIARGGLRLVSPKTSDRYAFESTRHFDEVYGLSLAQQAKNKDIPEGGSKGVILINTPAIPASTHNFALRKSTRAFTDALLDLIVENSVSKMVDFYGKDELIYLGPDEQIIASDIDWITQRAAQRGYPIPSAFMSSKAQAGFNHKKYGVTSEGVVVYLDVALRNKMNIDPTKTPFTVKITGGPNGDVAGNLIKILFREYGQNCKILGVADGEGVAEDPNGLNSEELLRLVTEDLDITHFNPAKLSKSGVVMKADNPEGIERRGTMHNRVKSDVFVPAGGRPETINKDNYHLFLDKEGKPSSPLIVEGANIFNTPEARKLLFKAGVTIVKDSSANKCGVITSSQEVQTSMLLSTAEFIQYREELAADVLKRLRVLARLEAELLFKAYHNYPGDLPDFSARISNAIATVTDAITDKLADVQPNDPLFKELEPLVHENLPIKLEELAGDRLASRFPVQYQRNAIASTLASKLVYHEGIHLVETQPYEKIAERAFMYYREDKKIRQLVKELESHDFKEAGEHKSVVIDLLKRGGARTSLNIF